MSQEAIDAVLSHSESKGSARLLLLCIARHARPDGTNACVPLPTLEVETRIDRREIQRFTKMLCEMGELQKRSGGGRTSSTYSILLPIPWSTSHGAEFTSGGSSNHGAGSISRSQSHGSGTASTAVSAPSIQETAVVGVVSQREQTTCARAQLQAELEAEGVAPPVALELVTSPIYLPRVQLQLACLSDRNPTDRAAMLVASIQKNWSPPRPYLERQQVVQARVEERFSCRQEAQAQDLANEQDRAAALEAERVQMDVRYQQLNEAQKALVDQEVAQRLGVLARHKSESAKGAIEAMRRLVLKERGENPLLC